MKRLILVFTCVFVMLSGAAMAQSKLAVIDIARCATTSNAGIKATEEIKKLESDRGAKLQPMQDELRKLENDFRAQEKVLTETARKAKLDELQRKGMEFQNMVVTYENELQKKNEEYTIKILDELEAIVETVAKEGKYDLVLHKQTVVFSPGAVDITDIVIQRYNQLYK